MESHYITPKIPEEEMEMEEEEEKKKEEKPKDEYSSWGIFFGVLLTAVFIGLWERAFIDLPRYFNPYFDNCLSKSAEIVNKLCNEMQYETIRLLLHIALVIPLLMIFVAVARSMAGKKAKSHSRIVFIAYFFSLLFISIHLFVEFAVFLYRYYRDVGNYVVLIVIALAFIALIVYLQKRFNRPKEK